MSSRYSFVTQTLTAVAVVCVLPTLIHGQNSRPAPQPGLKWTDEQLRQAVAPMRAGRGALRCSLMGIFQCLLAKAF